MRKRKRDIDFRYNLKVYWGLLKNYKLYLFFILFLVFINQTTIVAEKYLFKSIVDYGTEYSNNVLTRELFVQYLIIIGIIFVSFRIMRGAAQWAKLHFLNRCETSLMQDLKKKFFTHILNLSSRFHSEHKTGSLISRIIRGSGSIENITDLIVFNLAPLAFQLIVTVGAFFYFDTVSALIVIIFVITFIGYGFFVNKFQQQANIIVNDAEDIEKANISDFITNTESIKYFGKEKIITKKYSKITQNVKEKMIKHWDYFRYLDIGNVLIVATSIFFILYFPLIKFLNNAITLGSLVFIYTTFLSLMGPVHSFTHGIRRFFRGMAGFENLFQYGKISNEITEIPNAKKLKVNQGKIEFNNITFTYKKRNILKNFNLTIPANKKVALVGPSGAGKSTIVKLLYRLYDLDKGAILIDGKDIRNLKKESLRSELSIVPQECVLFDDTIYSNIKFSKPSAKRNEIFKAMRFSQLHRIVKNFPYQEKTIVGERGVKLSGGEKQRVSIARALLADKKVLVLDEATSSLDSETEFEIQKALEKLMENRTSIIIAHRLSTIMKADMIVVVDKGRVVQQGTHQQLIRQPGMYKKLWNLQKGGYIK